MRTIGRIVTRIVRTEFVRGIATLASGTFVAQLLVLLVSPLITRLYSPEDFGLLAVYVSIVATLSTVATLRYDAAIPLPKDEAEATAVLRLSLVAVATVSSIIAVGLVFLRDKVFELLDAEKLTDLWWLIPIGVALIGTYTSFNSWAVRIGVFGRISRTKVSQALASVSWQIGLGVLNVAPLGLLLGDLMGRSAGVLTLSQGTWDKLRHVNSQQVKRAARQYKRFPLVTSVSDLINTSGLQLPALLLSALFGPHVAGGFLLVQRVVGAPVGLIGTATGQVYLNRAARLRRENPAQLLPLFARTLLGLSVAGGLPLVALTWFSAPLVPVLFGADWLGAADMLRPLGIAYGMALVTAPLTHTLGVILEKQFVQLAWDVTRLTVVVLAIIGSAHLGFNALQAITHYSIGMCIMYAIYLVAAYWYVRAEARSLFS